ncbi:MAG: ATP-binding protein [Leptospirales bacterium]|nr:ATP-binding protein [Leptospirales bacterium]
MKEIWQKALRDLRPEMPPALHKALSADSSLREMSGNSGRKSLYLELRDSSLAPQLRGKWSKTIENRLSELTGRRIRLEFQSIQAAKASPTSSWLNPHWTLERFLRTKENQLACAAIEAVATRPGQATPLYVYGESGAGKTHLTHAFAHLALARRPELRIEHVALVDFRDEMSDSLQKGDMLNFKTRHRGFDVLILEDLQGMRNTAEALQEELFHVFDHYVDNGRQLIFTADRPAAELMAPRRLLSRLQSGLVVRLSLPARDGREQFLAMRCKERGIELPSSVRSYLASQILGGIRELESALNKVELLLRAGMPMDQPGLLREELRELASDDRPAYYSMDQIVDAVCRRYKVSRDNVMSSSRRAEYTLPRHVSMFLGLKYANLNKSAIARYFRKSDHTTVINAERNIAKRLQTELGFQRQLEEILERLRIECE